VNICVLGDIHGNAHALKAALDAAKKQDCEVLLITGDLIGYYFMPNEVIELIKPWKKYIVRGNHEDMLVKARRNPDFLSEIEKKYGSAIKYTIDVLSQSDLDMLCNLPHPLDLKIDGIKILLCHGTPWDNDVYVYPDAKTEVIDKCAQQCYDIVILGHTHYPMLKLVGETQLLNPGSIGQPRNRQPGAQWALLNTTTKKIKLNNEVYDMSSILNDVSCRHPELPYLSEVLTRK
jgi:putative phosphoesterase